MANDAIRRDGLVSGEFVEKTKELIDRKSIDLSKSERPEKDIQMQEIAEFQVYTWNSSRTGLEVGKVAIVLGEDNVRVANWIGEMIKAGVARLEETGTKNREGEDLYRVVPATASAAISKEGIITIPQAARRKERRAK